MEEGEEGDRKASAATAGEADPAPKPAAESQPKPSTPKQKSAPKIVAAKKKDEKNKQGGAKGDKTDGKKGDGKPKSKVVMPKKPAKPWRIKKAPCCHDFCIPPKSDPANYPKGLPWSGGKLKCLPGHCQDHKQCSEEESLQLARKAEDEERERDEQIQKCRRLEQQRKIDDAKDELVFFLRLLYLTNDINMVERFKQKIKKEDKSKEPSKAGNVGEAKSDGKEKEPSTVAAGNLDANKVDSKVEVTNNQQPPAIGEAPPVQTEPTANTEEPPPVQMETTEAPPQEPVAPEDNREVAVGSPEPENPPEPAVQPEEPPADQPQ